MDYQNDSSNPLHLRKSRSQHFIISKETLQYEAELLNCNKFSVLEIGAGDGRLSQLILEENPSSLSLVEIDKKFTSLLSKKFAGNKKVKVLQGDFLELPNNFKTDTIIGNIPYQITSKILLKLAKMKFKRAVLCLQKEVAQRICSPAASPDYGRLSVFCQLHFNIEPGRIVPRTYFTPMPKVDSQIIFITRKQGIKLLPKNLELISSSLFSHRLASVENALYHSRRAFGWDKKQALGEISKTIKFKDKKVFMLTPQEIVELANLLSSANTEPIR